MIAVASRTLGWMALHEGDYARAKRLFDEALARTRALGDTVGILIGLNNLAEVAVR